MSSDRDPGRKLSVFVGASLRTGSPSDDAGRPWTFILEENQTEELLAVQVGPTAWRLEETPAFSDVANWHDIIEGQCEADGTVRFIRVLQASGFQTFRHILPLEALQDPSLRALGTRLVAAGGWWENMMGGVLVFHVPPSAIHLLNDYRDLMGRYGLTFTA